MPSGCGTGSGSVPELGLAHAQLRGAQRAPGVELLGVGAHELEARRLAAVHAHRDAAADLVGQRQVLARVLPLGLAAQHAVVAALELGQQLQREDRR
jgi:hypothetical protein